MDANKTLGCLNLELGKGWDEHGFDDHVLFLRQSRRAAGPLCVLKSGGFSMALLGPAWPEEWRALTGSLTAFTCRILTLHLC